MTLFTVDDSAFKVTFPKATHQELEDVYGLRWSLNLMVIYGRGQS